MKRFLVILALLAVANLTAQAAGVPAVQKLLPVANAIKGFTILASSLQYGKGADISKIYDGGYELYTKNGVIDAARQMYQHGDDYVEVTAHTMTSAKAALTFLKYWQKEHKAKTLVKTTKSTGFVVTKPSTMIYFVQGKYFVTISAFHSGDKALKDTKAFRNVIEKSIPKG